MGKKFTTTGKEQLNRGKWICEEKFLNVKRCRRFLICSLLFFVFSFSGISSFATTYYNKSSGTAALQTTANWGTATDGTGTSPANFTTAGDIFDLYNGSTATIGAAWVITGVTLNVGNGAAMNLTIPSGFSLTGTGTVNVGAGATLTLQNATNPTLGVLNATSTVNYDGTGAQTIALATYGNLSLSGARSGTPAITLPSGTITVTGNFLATYTGAVTFTNTGNTVTYSTLSGGSAVAGITYNNVTLSNTSGTNTAGGNITVNGALTTTAGGTLDMATNALVSATILTNNGTINTQNTSTNPIPGGKTVGGTINYNAATGGQTIVSETSYAGLVISNTSGTNTAGGNLVVNTALTTTAGGTLDMTSAYVMSGTLTTITNNGIVETAVPTTTSATPFTTGKTWGGTGQVVYYATAGTQTVMAGTYNCGLKLLNTSGTNTASGNLTVNGTLTTTAGGTLDMTTNTLSGTGTPSNGGTITTTSITNPPIPAGQNWSPGTIIFARANGGQSLPAGTYGSLLLNNTSGTVTAVGAAVVNTALTTTAGGTLAMTTFQLSGSGTVTNPGTVTTTCTVNPAIMAGQDWSGSGTGAVTFALATGGQSIPSGTYGTLTLSNTSGTNTAVGNINVNTTLTTSGGTFDMTSYVLGGTLTTFTNGGTIKTQNTSATPIPPGFAVAGTVNYNAAGGGQTVVAETSYTNLTMGNTSGTSTAGGNIVVNGVLTTTAGGSFDMTAAYTLGGTLTTITNNGTLETEVPTTTSATPFPAGKTYGGTGQVMYAATSGAQTVMGGTYNCGLTLRNTSGTNSAAAVITANGTLTTTSGGTLDMTTFALAGTGTPANNGTITTSSTTNPALPAGKNWAPGTVIFALSTGGQFLPAGTYGTLTLNNTSGNVTAGGAVTVNTSLTTTSGGSLVMGVNQLLGAFTPTNNGTITTTCTVNPAIPSGQNWTGTTGGITFALATGGQSIPSGTYGVLTMANTSGTNTPSGSFTVTTSLVTTSGGTLAMGASQLLGAFTPTNNGTISTTCTVNPAIPSGQTWTGTTGTVIFANTAGGQYAPLGTYKNVTFNNTSGSDYAAGNITTNGGTLTTTAGGTLDMGTANILAGTSVFTNNGNIQTSVLTSTSATPLPSGKTWAGTITYAAASGAQTLVNGTYNNLTLANTSGTNSATGALTVNGTLTTTTGGTLDMTTFQLLGTVTPVNNGTITTSSVNNPALPTGLNWSGTTGAVIFALSTGGQSVPAGTYKTVTFSNTSGTTTAVGVMSVTGTLTTTSGGTLALSTFQLLGGFTPVNNGTITTTCTSNPPFPAGLNWTGTTGAVKFALAAGGQSIPAGTYQTLTSGNTSGTNTVVGAITVSTSLVTTSNGTLDMTTYQLLGAFTPTNNGTISTTCTVNPAIPSGQTWTGTKGVVIFASATGGQYVPLGTYKTITFSNTSGSDFAVGNITANGGTLTTTAGGTLDMGTTSILSGTSTFTNNGTIKTSVPTSVSATPIPAGKSWAGTIIYAAATGSQTVVSETHYTNLTLANTSGTNTSAGALAVVGNLTTTAGGTLDMTAAYRITSLTGTITNNGIIQTSVPTATSATPFPAGLTWGGTGTVLYAAAAGAQTVMSGTYNCGLKTGNTSGTSSASGAITSNGALITTSAGTLSMGTFSLTGTFTPTNNGIISTACTVNPAIPTGLNWTGTTGTVI